MANLVNRHSFYDQLKTQYIQEIHRDEMLEAALAEETAKKERGERAEVRK